MDTSIPVADEPLRALIAEYLERCLWFLRPDYYPVTPDEVLRVLDYIQRHGDREAFRRADEVRRCLFPPTSATSAVS